MSSPCAAFSARHSRNLWPTMPWPMTTIFMIRTLSICNAVVGTQCICTQHSFLCLMLGTEAHRECAQRRQRNQHAEHGERLLDVAKALHEETRCHGTHVAARADNPRHAAQRPAIDERHECVGRATGHVRE